MSLLKELIKKELLNNITNQKKANIFFKNKGNIYIGFDPSFYSLHIGNLIMIILLRKFNDDGFKTFAIIGGATGMIGDPSGKNNERHLLSKEELEFNKKKISKQLKQYSNSQIIDNSTFYENMNVLVFLRDIGKHANINTMLEKEIIKNRLSTGISFTEFTYSILQAYDFYTLWKNKGINLQIGGSDQWANITSGIDLIKKIEGKNEAFGITINLLTKKDGTKFGKSEKGAIYLDKNITSPYEMYQFFFNQEDDDIQKIFNFFSFKKFNEIKTIMTNHKKNPKKRIAQKKISYEMVSFIHGEKIANEILKMNEIIFKKKFKNLTLKNFEMICSNNLIINVQEKQISIINALVNSNMVSSFSQARKLIEQNSIKINGENVKDIKLEINFKNGYFNKYSIIQKGKKEFLIIKWQILK